MKRGFTAINFLVVVAIISLIAALMFPFFAQKMNHSSSINYTIVQDEWVGGNHIQVLEDKVTHTRTKMVNNQVMSEILEK